MITIYPTENWNSFVTLDEAMEAIESMGGGAEWSSLDGASKEQKLILSASIISSIVYLDCDCDFKGAQNMLLLADILNNNKYLSLTDNRSKYKTAKVGSLSVQYNDSSLEDNLPSTVISILSDCLKNNETAQGFFIG